MLKKIAVCCVVMIVFIGFAGRMAQAAEEKIALVSLQRALYETEDGKKALATLKADSESKKKKLEGIENEWKAMYAELDKQKDILSKDKLALKYKELQVKRDDWQAQYISFEKDYRAKSDESSKKIMAGLRTELKELITKSGYTLVIENSADVVLYSANATDITNDLIAAYNKK